MAKLITVLALLLFVILACAEPSPGHQLQRQLRSGAAAALPPYLFLSVPRANGNGHGIQGFRVETDNDDDEKAPFNHLNNDYDDDEEESNDDDDNEEEQIQQDDEGISLDDKEELENDDDEDDNMENYATNNLVYLRSRVPHTPRVRSQLKNEASVMSMMKKNAQLVLKNAKPTNMMVSRKHAGAIMVPDGLIEIEGQTVVDEKTGKTSLLVPRSVIDAIPEGSVVALLEGSAQDSEEARANRVIVRRRRKGSRRNVVRRGGGGNRRNRRRQGGQRRRMQVYRIGGTNNRRRRVRRPVVLQG